MKIDTNWFNAESHPAIIAELYKDLKRTKKYAKRISNALEDHTNANHLVQRLGLNKGDRRLYVLENIAEYSAHFKIIKERKKDSCIFIPEDLRFIVLVHDTPGLRIRAQYAHVNMYWQKNTIHPQLDTHVCSDVSEEIAKQFPHDYNVALGDQILICSFAKPSSSQLSQK